MTNWVLFILGAAMLFIAIYLYKVTNRASLLSRGSTYSKSVNRAILDTGIYTEHGMVLDSDGLNVRAESKKARAFYESFI